MIVYLEVTHDNTFRTVAIGLGLNMTYSSYDSGSSFVHVQHDYTEWQLQLWHAAEERINLLEACTACTN